MYSLSRRVIIMLSGAIALLVLVTIFGVYGAPTAEHLLDVPGGGGAESRLQGDDLIEEDRALRDYELKQVHVVSGFWCAPKL